MRRDGPVTESGRFTSPFLPYTSILPQLRNLSKPYPFKSIILNQPHTHGLFTDYSYTTFIIGMHRNVSFPVSTGQ